MNEVDAALRLAFEPLTDLTQALRRELESYGGLLADH